jgi:hypothetical protein
LRRGKDFESIFPGVAGSGNKNGLSREIEAGDFVFAQARCRAGCRLETGIDKRGHCGALHGHGPEIIGHI